MGCISDRQTITLDVTCAKRQAYTIACGCHQNPGTTALDALVALVAFRQLVRRRTRRTLTGQPSF